MDFVFKALADKSRREILKLLKQRDMSVMEIQKHFSFTQASLSHHLDILKRSHLVVTERKGQYIYYSRNLSVVEEMVKVMMDYFEK